jgi:hypothetical protein
MCGVYAAAGTIAAGSVPPHLSSLLGDAQGGGTDGTALMHQSPYELVDDDAATSSSAQQRWLCKAAMQADDSKSEEDDEHSSADDY